MIADRPVWNGPPVDAMTGFACAVQMRAHGSVTPADVVFDGDAVDRSASIEPQRGIAAGQAAVLYGGADGDTVLGSATITSTRRSP